MAKAAANRDKDREFDLDLLRYGFVKPEQAIEMVALMPLDDKAKRDPRVRIRRWAKLLQERGYDYLSVDARSATAACARGDVA